MKSTTLTILQILFSITGFTQISVAENTAANLVNEVLSGQSISISNIQYWGSPSAIGYFDGDAINIPFENGLVITTGNIYQILGPNDNTNNGVDNNYEQINPHLISLVGGFPCFNGANIEFDFVPDGDSLILEYIFGSEEYSEYVGEQFSDVFGIFLSGPGINGVQNIATLSNGDRISINTINNGNPNATPPVYPSNPAYFITNANSPLAPPYTTNPAYIEYDGFTVPLVASASLIPNENYHLELSIADVGDGIYDSGVLIKAHSLTAGTSKWNLSDAFTISPNPITDAVTINYNRDTPGKVEIYDMIGNHFGEYEFISHTTLISLSDLPKGMYMMKFITTEGQCSKLVSKI